MEMTTADKLVAECPVRGTQWTLRKSYSQVCAFHVQLVAATQSLPNSHPLSWLLHRPIDMLPLGDMFLYEVKSTSQRRRQQRAAAKELLATAMHVRVVIDGYCWLKESSTKESSVLVSFGLAPFLLVQHDIDAFLSGAVDIVSRSRVHAASMDAAMVAVATTEKETAFKRLTDDVANDSQLQYLHWLFQQVNTLLHATNTVVDRADNSVRRDIDFLLKRQWLIEVSRQSYVILRDNKALYDALVHASRLVATDDEDDDPCGICWGSMAEASLVATLVCSHRFHKACVLQWSLQRKICPMCCRVLTV